MEIQNKEEQNTPELTEDSLQDTSAKQEEAEIQEETESQEEQNPSSNRRFLLWTLAGSLSALYRLQSVQKCDSGCRRCKYRFSSGRNCICGCRCRVIVFQCKEYAGRG